MNKIIRTLTFSDEVSLVLIDATDMVNDAIAIHDLSAPAAVAFGKAMIAMTYLSGWLKDETGQISANIKGNGEGGTICISGDSSLNMRGTIQNADVHSSEDNVIGHEGYMTIVRDDGYKQPFVGTVAFHDGRIERLFMDYYAISEQLPTYIKEEVLIDENKRCTSAVGLFMQAMPGASDSAKMSAYKATESLDGIAAEVREKGAAAYVNEHFPHGDLEERDCAYRCKCSRERIEGLILSMNRAEVEDILLKDGKLNVHCDYCNTDYDFYPEDIEKLFLEA